MPSAVEGETRPPITITFHTLVEGTKIIYGQGFRIQLKSQVELYSRLNSLSPDHYIFKLVKILF